MEIQKGNNFYNINAHPYKGVYRINDYESKNAYFFDARLTPHKPLSAYIIYKDDDNSIHILTGYNDIEDIQNHIETINDPTNEEVINEYFPLLMGYIQQNNLDINPTRDNPYLEDNIILAIAKGQQQSR